MPRPVSPSRSDDCVPGQHRRVARADQRQGVVRSYSRRTRHLLRAPSCSPCYIPSWSHSEDIGRCSRSMWRCRRFSYETSQWDTGTIPRTSGSESPTYLSDPCSQYNSMKPTNWRLSGAKRTLNEKLPQPQSERLLFPKAVVQFWINGPISTAANGQKRTWMANSHSIVVMDELSCAMRQITG